MNNIELEREVKHKEEIIQGQISEMYRLHQKIAQLEIMLEKSEKQRKKDKNDFKDKNQDLIKENQKLINERDMQITIRNMLESKLIKTEHELTPNPVHNARGAGRKPTVNKQMIKKIHDLSNAGLTQKNIALEIGMSSATVNRILKSKINYEKEN